MSTRSKKTVAVPGAAGDRYIKLIQSFPLRPIRNEAELVRAIAVIDRLIDRVKLSPDEQDYLDVLGDLVHKFEQERFPDEPVSDADMLRHFLESRDVTQSEVAAATGIATSTLCEILAAKRKLNRRHIAALAAYFKADPGVFLRQ